MRNMLKRKLSIKILILITCIFTFYFVERSKSLNKIVSFEIILNEKVNFLPGEYNYKIDKFLLKIYKQSFRKFKNNLLFDFHARKEIKRAVYNVIPNNDLNYYHFLITIKNNEKNIIEIISEIININNKIIHEVHIQTVAYLIKNKFNDIKNFNELEINYIKNLLEQNKKDNHQFIYINNLTETSSFNPIFSILFSLLFGFFVIYFYDLLLLKKYKRKPNGKK